MNPEDNDTQILDKISFLLSIKKWREELLSWVSKNLNMREIMIINEQCEPFKVFNVEVILKLHKLAIIELINCDRDMRDQAIFENKHE